MGVWAGSRGLGQTQTATARLQRRMLWEADVETGGNGDEGGLNADSMLETGMMRWRRRRTACEMDEVGDARARRWLYAVSAFDDGDSEQDSTTLATQWRCGSRPRDKGKEASLRADEGVLRVLQTTEAVSRILRRRRRRAECHDVDDVELRTDDWRALDASSSGPRRR